MSNAIARMVDDINAVFKDEARFSNVDKGWHSSDDAIHNSHAVREGMSRTGGLYTRWQGNWQSSGAASGGPPVHAEWAHCPDSQKKLDELCGIDLWTIHDVAVRVDSLRKVAEILHSGFKAAEAELDQVWGGKAAEAARKQFSDFGEAAKKFHDQAQHLTAHVMKLRENIAQGLGNFDHQMYSTPFDAFLNFYYNEKGDDQKMPGYDGPHSSGRQRWASIIESLGDAADSWDRFTEVVHQFSLYKQSGDESDLKPVGKIDLNAVMQRLYDDMQGAGEGRDSCDRLIVYGKLFGDFCGWYNFCVDQQIQNTDTLHKCIRDSLSKFATDVGSMEFNQFSQLTNPGGKPPGKAPQKDPFNGKPPNPDVPKPGSPPTSPSGSPSTPKTPDTPSTEAPKTPDMPSSASPKTPDVPSTEAPKTPDMPSSASPKTPDVPKPSTPKTPEVPKSDFESSLDDSKYKPKSEDFKPEHYETPDFKSPKFGGTSASSVSPHSFDPKDFSHSTKGLGSLGGTSPSSSHGGGASFGAGGLGGGLGKGETTSSSGSRKGSLGAGAGGAGGGQAAGPVSGAVQPGTGGTGSGGTGPAAAGAAGGAAGAKAGGAGGGMMGGMGGAGKGQGGDEKEHKRKFKYMASPDELFGSDEKAVPPVIGGDPSAAKPRAKR